MAASPASIREFYYRVGTFNTVHSNAADGASWNAVANASVVKLAICELDVSGLDRTALPDETLQGFLDNQPPPIAGPRTGAIKFSSYMGAAYTNTDIHPQANIVATILGGVRNPSTRSGTLAANSGTTNIALASAPTIVQAGDLVLVGTRGDGKGDGEVKPVATVGADHFNVAIACKAAPASGDAYVVCTLAYPLSNTPQQTIDTLSVGHANADQYQTLGGIGPFSITGLGPAELPKLGFELKVGDWRVCPADGRIGTTPTFTSKGTRAANDRGLGMFHLGDASSTARSAVKAGEFAFSPGVNFEPVPDLTGTNGIGGWQRIKGGATFESTVLYDEDMPGLADDFEATTAVQKKVLFQSGHVQGRGFAIYMANAYLAEMPKSAVLSNLQAVKTKFIVSKAGQVENAAGAPYVIGWF